MKAELSSEFYSPLRLFAITIGGIFLAEVIAMVVVYVLGPIPYYQTTLIDAGIMTVLIFPVLYFLSLRPLVLHIDLRRRVERALREGIELQKRFFNSIDTLVAYMDRDFNFIRVNDAYARADGRPPGYFIGRNHFALYPHPENQAIFQRVVESGEAYSVYEKPFEYPDQPERGVTYWNWSLQPVRGDGENVEGLVLSLVDVTQRKLAAVEVERRSLELQALSAVEHKQRQVAETLRSSAQALAQTLELDTILRTLLTHIRSLVEADTASVIFPESETLLGVRAAEGYEQWTDPTQITSIKLDSSTNPIFQRLVSAQKSILIPDTAQDPDWEVYPGTQPIRNYLIVPILIEGKIIGVVGLGNIEAGHFTEEHVQWAEALVGQAAVAIQNAWLFEQVRAGRERLQFLSRRLVEIHETERRFIARELHDHAGQTLTSLILGLGALEKEAHEPQSVRTHAAELKRLTDGVLEDLHRLAIHLRPASLDHLGLVSALDQLVRSFAQSSPLHFRFKALGICEDDRLPQEVETTFYRITQEALTNVVRHAAAQHADVVLERRGDVALILVEDDGQGFDVEQAKTGGHLGLLGMEERAEMLGGKLTLESVPGRGTTLVVEVPYGNPNPARG